jgi:hypothetical protein
MGSMTGNGLRCMACGEPITEDQTVLRLSVGTARDDDFSHLLMRPDVLLHAGTPAPPDAWSIDEPPDERWCATPAGLDRALAALRLSGMTGASGRYRGE